VTKQCDDVPVKFFLYIMNNLLLCATHFIKIGKIYMSDGGWCPSSLVVTFLWKIGVSFLQQGILL